MSAFGGKADIATSLGAFGCSAAAGSGGQLLFK
jgi:hypothetical protein